MPRYIVMLTKFACQISDNEYWIHTQYVFEQIEVLGMSEPESKLKRLRRKPKLKNLFLNQSAPRELPKKDTDPSVGSL